MGSKRASGKRSVRKKAGGRAGQPGHLRVALAQINMIVGDFKGNVDKVKTWLRHARKHQADLVLFPELCLTGYPPEDLLLKEGFIKKNLQALSRVVPQTAGITALIGYAEPSGGVLYNAAALVSNRKLLGSYRKILLPNYGVFDEKRYFCEGSVPARFTMNGITLGVTVCEDIWEADGPGKALCGEGQADVLLNISSSPFHKGKGKMREEMIRKRARRYKAFVVYANLVGGQDELIFDGQSLVVSPGGTVLARGNSFAEEMIFADLTIHPKSGAGKKKRAAPRGIKTFRVPAAGFHHGPREPLPHRAYREKSEVEEIYDGLVMGTRDYLAKNGFAKVVIGLSGGIDSSLTAAIAVDALGPDNVIGVLMPSPHSSRGSVEDALKLAVNLKIRTLTLPIAEAMQAFENILKGVFAGTPKGLAEENLQARIRGNLLMALSNKMGWLVLTTGNKSEVSVGYCTLYGDMAGGFAVIKDVPKTWVYELSRWVNEKENRPVIPEAVLTKEPSAELRPGQKDTDSLPPYPLLDALLARYIEEDRGIKELRGLGLGRSEIREVVRRVDANEYKRRQAPPGIKITPKAFGRDRRLPITNRYSENDTT